MKGIALGTGKKTSQTGATAIAAFEARRTVDVLLDGADPANAIHAVLARATSTNASSFDRYVAKSFNSAHIEAFYRICNEHTLKILQPERGKLARIVCAQTLDANDQRVVASIENTINRMICIMDALEDGVCDDAPSTERLDVGISFMGSGFLPTREGFRSAQIKLPRIEERSQISEKFYNEIDWRVMESVASNSRSVFQNSLMLNPSLSVLGFAAVERGNWDVRTRLAYILEHLELPLRCSFAFDCDTEVGVASVRFVNPPRLDLPDLPEGVSADGATDMHSRAYTALTVRLACLMSAACFGAGRAVQKAFVTAVDEKGRALLSCVFGRDAYVRSVMGAIDSGAFSNVSSRFDPKPLIKLANAEEMLLADRAAWVGEDSGFLSSESLPDDGMARQRRAPGNDERQLPNAMKRLFRAQRVCDISTQRSDDGSMDALDAAEADSHGYLLSAVLRLEAIVAEGEGLLRQNSNGTSARPLYAPHPLARLAINLIDDELAVSQQAQRFLDERENQANEKDGDGLFEPAGSSHAVIEWETCRADGGADAESSLFCCAPESLYWALMGLSNLYQRLGDLDGAAARANQCIALAPTASRPYLRKAEVLNAKGLHTQAANTIMDGLRCATTVGDSSFLYYHLGSLLWGLGYASEAAAVHVYNAAFMGVYCEKSRKAVEDMKALGTIPIAHEGSTAAMRHLMRFGIPIAPVKVGPLVAQAVLGLADAHAPVVAAPYAHILEGLCSDNSVVVAACRSIRRGTNLS